MMISPLPPLPTVPRTGTWYRAVQPRYYPQLALQMAYTLNVASRFYAGASAHPQFQTLYLAQSPQIALYEVEALYGSLTNPVANLRSITIFDVEIQLQRLVNLADTGVQSLLQTSIQELTGDWRSYGINAALAPSPISPQPAPTQLLGAALFKFGVEGLLTVSAKNPKAVSLVVFPENLQQGSFVRHTEPVTQQVYML